MATKQQLYFTQVYNAYLDFQNGQIEAKDLPQLPQSLPTKETMATQFNAAEQLREAREIYNRAVLAAAEYVVNTKGNAQQSDHDSYFKYFGGIAKPVDGKIPSFSGNKATVGVSHPVLDNNNSGKGDGELASKNAFSGDDKKINPADSKEYTTYTTAVAYAMAVDNVLTQLKAHKKAAPADFYIDMERARQAIYDDHEKDNDFLLKKAPRDEHGKVTLTEFTHNYHDGITGGITARLNAAAGPDVALPSNAEFVIPGTSPTLNIPEPTPVSTQTTTPTPVTPPVADKEKKKPSPPPAPTPATLTFTKEQNSSGVAVNELFGTRAGTTRVIFDLTPGKIGLKKIRNEAYNIYEEAIDPSKSKTRSDSKAFLYKQFLEAGADTDKRYPIEVALVIHRRACDILDAQDDGKTSLPGITTFAEYIAYRDAAIAEAKECYDKKHPAQPQQTAPAAPVVREVKFSKTDNPFQVACSEITGHRPGTIAYLPATFSVVAIKEADSWRNVPLPMAAKVLQSEFIKAQSDPVGHPTHGIEYLFAMAILKRTDAIRKLQEEGKTSIPAYTSTDYMNFVRAPFAVEAAPVVAPPAPTKPEPHKTPAPSKAAEHHQVEHHQATAPHQPHAVHAGGHFSGGEYVIVEGDTLYGIARKPEMKKLLDAAREAIDPDQTRRGADDIAALNKDAALSVAIVIASNNASIEKVDEIHASPPKLKLPTVAQVQEKIAIMQKDGGILDDGHIDYKTEMKGKQVSELLSPDAQPAAKKSATKDNAPELKGKTITIASNKDPVDAAVAELLTGKPNVLTAGINTEVDGQLTMVAESAELHTAVQRLLTASKEKFVNGTEAERKAVYLGLHDKIGTSQDPMENAATEVALNVLIRAEQIQAQQRLAAGAPSITMEAIGNYTMLVAKTQKRYDEIESWIPDTKETDKPKPAAKDKTAGKEDETSNMIIGDLEIDLKTVKNRKNTEKIIARGARHDEWTQGQIDQVLNEVRTDMPGADEDTIYRAAEMMVAATNNLADRKSKISMASLTLTLPTPDQIKTMVKALQDPKVAASYGMKPVAFIGSEGGRAITAEEADMPVSGLAAAIKKPDVKGK